MTSRHIQKRSFINLFALRLNRHDFTRQKLDSCGLCASCMMLWESWFEILDPENKQCHGEWCSWFRVYRAWFVTIDHCCHFPIYGCHLAPPMVVVFDHFWSSSPWYSICISVYNDCTCVYRLLSQMVCENQSPSTTWLDFKWIENAANQTITKSIIAFFCGSLPILNKRQTKYLSIFGCIYIIVARS